MIRRKHDKSWEEIARERAVKELISSIRRMWHKGPDAPPNPPFKPNGIRERAYISAKRARTDKSVTGSASL
jgi:hypothetical protein